MAATVSRPGQQDQASRRAPIGWGWLAGAAVVLLGLALRLFGIDARAIWTDETYSLFWAGYPLTEIPGILLRHEAHPPLYYLLLHAWAPFSESDLLLRLPSAVFGAASVLAVFWLGRRVLDRWTGVLAAVVAATMPLQVWYGQEARPYALLTLLGALAALALLAIFERPGRWPVAAYAAVAAAALHTHYGAAFLLVGLNAGPLVAAFRPAAKSWRRSWLWANLLAALLFLPWVIAVVMRQIAPNPGVFTVSYRVIPPDLIAVREVLLDLIALGAPFWRLPGGRPEALIAGALGLAALGAWRLRGRDHFMLAGALIGMLVGSWLMAQRYPLFFQSKVVAPLGVPLAVLLAAGVSVVWRRWAAAGAAAAGLLLLLNGAGLWRVYAGAPVALAVEDWRGAAAVIAAEAGPDDLLLFLPAGHALPFLRVYDDGGQLPELRGVPIDSSRAAPALEKTARPSDLPRLAEVIAGRRRVWLVTVTPANGPHLNIPLVTDYLAAHMGQVERIDRAGIVIYRYSR